jgi:hypothetical protein
MRKGDVTSTDTAPAVLYRVARLDQGVACVLPACLLRRIDEPFHRAPDHVLDEARHCFVLASARLS